MNVLPAGFTPPIGVRRTITDECFGMWASSSVYSKKHEKTNYFNKKKEFKMKPNYQNLSTKIHNVHKT